MEQSQSSPQELFVRMSKEGCLQERIAAMFKCRGAEEAGLVPDDFHTYGRVDETGFDPYWRDDETFESFTQRESGVSRDTQSVVGEAINHFFIRNGVPLSSEDSESLSSLASIFSREEVDALQAHAVIIEDEMAQSLALAFQEMGTLPPGSVRRVESPLISLHEAADPEIADFFEEVKQSADGVYGVPKFYPQPETDPEIVGGYRNREVIYSEPQVRSFEKTEDQSWAATLQGESREAKNNIPVFNAVETVQLVVLDQDANKTLTSSLLKKKNLLRYWLGAKIIDLQRDKMADLIHIFSMVWTRKEFDGDGKGWSFQEPAKRPE